MVMAAAGIDTSSLLIVLAGAFLAGFTTGFAGFGTALVSSGLWFHALSAPMVPPLVVITAAAAQMVGLVTVRNSFDWSRAAPYALGGLAGVPFGVALLAVVSPDLLRLSVGVFLVAYATFQLSGLARLQIKVFGGGAADFAVGAAGGFLGGFAGLSGPLPLIWLQLRGGSSGEQRAIYQPFNLVVLAAASVAMGFAGQIDRAVALVAAACLPVTLLAAALGARLYTRVSAETFRAVILLLLLGSGLVLIGQIVSI
jgi:uncharacterized membrane protein YfcA